MFAIQGVLRTKETIDRFKSVPPVQGQTSPLLLYFGTLLSRGKLNAYESVELAILVLSQNKKHLLDNWLRDVRPLPSQYPTALNNEDPQLSCVSASALWASDKRQQYVSYSTSHSRDITLMAHTEMSLYFSRWHVMPQFLMLGLTME